MRATNGRMTGRTRRHAGESHYWQPGGPITGKHLVPCLWQNHPSGGPMLVAADIDQLGIQEKDGSGLSKRQPYTGVQRCHQRKRSPPRLHQRVTNALAGPCPNIPQNPLGAPNPTPARPADLPFITASSRASSVSPVHGQSPALRGQRSCTAAQYSNPAAQHRPITPAIGRRPAEITIIDCPARSSGRRGRGFESRHPDSKTPGQRAV
jgi:hypothetical protein